MNRECELIRDLMPLVLDGAASPASQYAVRGHLAECAECRAQYKAMGRAGAPGDNQTMPEVVALQALGKRLRLSQGLLIALGLLLTVPLLATGQQFALVLLFPAMGLISYFALRRVWIFPAICAGASLLYLVTRALLEGAWDGAVGSLPYGMLAFLLTLAGAAMGLLLYQVFRQDEGSWFGRFRNRWGRFAAKAAVCLALATAIAGGLFVYEALNGNPVLPLLLPRRMDAHLEARYPDQDFNVGAVQYDMKQGRYVAEAYALAPKGGLDEKAWDERASFAVWWSFSGGYGDEYEQAVLYDERASERVSASAGDWLSAALAERGLPVTEVQAVATVRIDERIAWDPGAKIPLSLLIAYDTPEEAVGNEDAFLAWCAQIQGTVAELYPWATDLTLVRLWGLPGGQKELVLRDGLDRPLEPAQLQELGEYLDYGALNGFDALTAEELEQLKENGK